MTEMIGYNVTLDLKGIISLSFVDQTRSVRQTSNMCLNRKNIFLLDGVGALLSSIFTGLLLPLFSEDVGISTSVLHCLALIPFIYGIYSISCYLFPKITKPWMLITIIVANIAYCLLSGAIILRMSSITPAGQVLLSAEIFLILCVVGLELKVYRTFTKI